MYVCCDSVCAMIIWDMYERVCKARYAVLFQIWTLSSKPEDEAHIGPTAIWGQGVNLLATWTSPPARLGRPPETAESTGKTFHGAIRRAVTTKLKLLLERIDGIKPRLLGCTV